MVLKAQITSTFTGTIAAALTAERLAQLVEGTNSFKFQEDTGLLRGDLHLVDAATGAVLWTEQRALNAADAMATTTEELHIGSLLGMASGLAVIGDTAEILEKNSDLPDL